MAKAATPGGAGTSEHAAKTDAAKQVLRIRVKDEVRTLAAGIVPVKEKMIVQQATNMSYEAVMASPGEFSVVVLWWLAGRAAGNAFLTLDTVMAEWPELEDGDLKVDIIDPDGDDPEA